MSWSVNPVRVLAAYTGLFIVAAGVVCGQINQTDTSPARGIVPTGEYRAEEMGVVNAVSGALYLQVPVTRLPQNRGGQAGFDLSLLYNSGHYDVHTTYAGEISPGEPNPISNLQSSPESGWRYSYQYSLDFERRPVDTHHTLSCQNPIDRHNAAYVFRLTLVLPDGSRHLLRMTGQSDTDGDGAGDGYYAYDPNGNWSNSPCASGTNLSGDRSYYTVDGTYLNVLVSYVNGVDSLHVQTLSWKLYFPDGSYNSQTGFAFGVYSHFDRNLNGYSVTNTTLNGHFTTQISDNAQRKINVEHVPAPLQDNVSMKGAKVGSLQTGDLLQWTVTWRNITGITRNYVCGDNSQTCSLTPTDTVVDQIVEPQQLCDPATPNCLLHYQFGYNTDSSGGGLAEVSSITIPSGAVSTFTYRMDNTGAPCTGGGCINYTAYLQDQVTSQTLTADGVSELTTYQYLVGGAYQNRTISPDGGLTDTYYVAGDTSKGGLVYKVSHPDGTITERFWLDNVPSGAQNTSSIFFSNPYVKTEYTTIAGKTTVKDYQYDKNGNVTSIAEYDWFSLSLHPVPRDGLGLPAGLPSGLVAARTTLTSYLYSVQDASEVPTADPNTYVYASSQLFRSAVAAREVRTGTSGGAVASRVEYSYTQTGSNAASLQVTEERDWDSTQVPTTPPVPLTSASAIIWSFHYDSYGNRDSATEPGRSTTDRSVTIYTYDATATVDSVAAPGIFLTQIDEAYGTTVQRTKVLSYDVWLGLVTNSVDDNVNNVSVKTTYDSFGRPILVQEAFGNSTYERQTATTYSVQQRRTIISSDRDHTLDRLLITVLNVDQRGRLVLHQQLEDHNIASATDPTAGIKTATQYSNSSQGRYQAVSNPYRLTSDPTIGWTRTAFDTVGRPVERKAYSGSPAPPPWGGNTTTTGTITTAYNGTIAGSDRIVTTVTDQQNKVRQSVIDAMGRLTRVIEDPSGSLHYQTDYSYDALDDLTTVTQNGQLRTFGYTSLQRLSSATNPESVSASNQQSGTISYLYNRNGNVTSRTLPSGAVTAFSYDARNRVTLKSFSGGPSTPAVTYCYDGWVAAAGDGQCTSATAAQSHGRLTQVRSTATTISYTAFDPLGHVTAHNQVTDGSQPYLFSYVYNLAGGLTSMTYPSQRQVSFGYDDVARVNAVKNGPIATGTSYASTFVYAPHGAVQSMNLGNSLWETTTFNSRLQPVDMQLGTSQGDSSLWQLHMSYSSASITGNNGNVMQQVISAPGLSLTQVYTYDGGNRLHLAAENPTNMTTPACPDAGSHWCETFDYDNWGNRLVTARSVLGVSPLEPTSFDAANHITTTGWSYESSRTGNISTDPLNRTMAYDGENRMVAICTQDPSSCVNAAGAGRTLYRYDGDGKRVEKLPADGSKTIYVYDASGLLAAEYVTPASGSGGTEYVTTDQLGSTRVVTSGSGAVLERRDYLPFGEDLLATAANGRVGVTGYGGNAGISQKFTGKERDAETGLDYFGARYFSGAQGRFTSPDPKQFPHGITDPQSWNKYAYTRNNPLRYVDPDGEDWQDYLKGAINAFTSNNTGVGRISSGNGDFKTGQAIGDAISTVTGALETVIGSGGEVLGVGLDATGAGAVLGVPLNVASAGLIVHGGTTAVVSSVHLAQDVNEATSSGQPYENTPQNQERMSQGKAPVGKDGKAVELHHEGQASEGNLKEMTQSEHRGGENFSKNHPNTGQQPSQIDRSKFKQQREQYWKDKAKKPDQQ